MDEWTLRAAREASEAQQGLFKAQLEEPSPSRNHDEDPLAPARGLMWGFAFSLGVYFFCGAVVIAVLLLW